MPSRRNPWGFFFVYSAIGGVLFLIVRPASPKRKEGSKCDYHLNPSLCFYVPLTIAMVSTGTTSLLFLFVFSLPFAPT